MAVLTVLWLSFFPPHSSLSPFAGRIVVLLQELENIKKGDVVIEPTAVTFFFSFFCLVAVIFTELEESCSLTSNYTIKLQ